MSTYTFTFEMCTEKRLCDLLYNDKRSLFQLTANTNTSQKTEEKIEKTEDGSNKGIRRNGQSRD